MNQKIFFYIFADFGQIKIMSHFKNFVQVKINGHFANFGQLCRYGQVKKFDKNSSSKVTNLCYIVFCLKL